MKLKVRLNTKLIQEFLLQNVEKIVLGVVVLVFLLMLYSAMTKAGRFDRTPEQLQQAVAAGKAEIDKTPSDSGLVVSDYVKQAHQSRVPVKEEPYSHTMAWDSPVFERRQPRDAAPLFAVQELRGTAGVGAFRTGSGAGPAAPGGPGYPPSYEPSASPYGPSARPYGPSARPYGPSVPGLRPPGPTAGPSAASRGSSKGAPTEPAASPSAVDDEPTRGKRWVVLTALVPVEKQKAAYANAFRLSVGYDAQRDYPKYLGSFVQRVEVSSPAEAANPDWSKAPEIRSPKAVDAAMQEWGAAKEDVVSLKYLWSSPEPQARAFPLVFPLGPLDGRDWDASVAHEPDIPMMKPDELRGGPMGESMRTNYARGPEAVSGHESSGDDTIFGNEPRSFDPGRRPALDPGRNMEEQKAPSHQLFRFFDFNVEPGKQYVYRVCLVLDNPNKGIPPAHLKTPELAKGSFIRTGWSENSPIIAVPRETRILASSVKPALRAGSDPSGRIFMIKWLQKRGVEVSEEFPVTRGQVANFMDVSVKLPSSSGQRTIEDSPTALGRGGAAPPPRTLKEDFVSNATAVDFRGGEPLPASGRSNKLNAVGEILVLYSDGKLSVHNELDDTLVYERFTRAHREPAGPEAVGSGTATTPSGVRASGGLDSLDENKPGRRKTN